MAGLPKKIAISTVALFTVSFVISLPVAASPDLEKGAQVFEDVCAMCHGEQAQGGEDFEAPKLAGQFGWYLRRQLDNFRAGIRGTDPTDENGQVMRPMAIAIPADSIDDVVAYIQTLDANFRERDY